MATRTDQIQDVIGDVAASVRLCQHRLAQITRELEMSGTKTELTTELRRAAETFTYELGSTTTALQTAASMTEEDLGGVTRQPTPDDVQADLERFEKINRRASTRDLAAAARWMVQALAPSDRQMLIGLGERLGTFEAGLRILPEMLSIAGSSTEVVWSMEDLHLLLTRKKKWRRLDDVGKNINIRAVLFLLNAMIESRHSPRHLPEIKALRNRLKAIEKGGGDDL